ncbi:MAG: PLP-dependent aminotransferase family protein [Treponema sp.]|nr:PLP-dependent aminotransferase family protein [Treponema sp.]
MITFSPDFAGTLPLYEQLYDFLKARILDGTFSSGEKLPSKRNLAKNLGVSVITVEKSYALLCDEGLLESRVRSGFFVAQGVSDFFTSFRARATQSDSHNSSVAGQKSEGWYIDFSSNKNDVKKFPFSIWAKLIRDVLGKQRHELLENPPAKGSYNLRSAISRHLEAFRAMRVEPERIVLGAGTEYLYGLLVQLLGFDRRYGIENPGYGKIQKVYDRYGVECRKIGMDKDGIMLGELEDAAVDVIHISPSHHFPTGIVMPMSRRMELLRWADSGERRYIIEDDYDSEFRFSGKPLPSLKSIDKGEKVIYMNTFSKTLASTIRISYMVLPQRLNRVFDERLSFYSCTVPTIEQFTLEKFISKGFFEKHINRMRKNYHMKRDLILHLIETCDKQKKFQVLEENSGLHFLMRLSESEDVGAFRRRMDKEKIRILPLSMYYENPPPDSERVFVMNYAGIPEEKIEEAIHKLVGG